VLAIDRPGYGFSAPQPEDRMRPDRQARWLADVVRMLGAERPIIVAHSFAASIALWLAYRHPKAIAGLVLIAPFCRPTTPAWRPLLRLAAMRGVGRPVRWVLPRIARRLAPRQLLSAFDPNPVPPHMHRLPFEIAAQPAAVLAMAAELRGFNVAMGRLSGRLYGLKTPTVLICGETDRVTAWDHHGGWLASRLPDCAVITVRDVGHMVHHVRPRVVAAAVDLVAANRPKRRGVRLMA
jgi:pimeloyl-ACP methyl ester carboxylesterase